MACARTGRRGGQSVRVEQVEQVLDSGDELLGAVEVSQQPTDKLVRRWSLLVLAAGVSRPRQVSH
jgi:hypothetical protein